MGRGGSTVGGGTGTGAVVTAGVTAGKGGVTVLFTRVVEVTRGGVEGLVVGVVLGAGASTIGGRSCGGARMSALGGVAIDARVAAPGARSRAKRTTNAAVVASATAQRITPRFGR